MAGIFYAITRIGSHVNEVRQMPKQAPTADEVLEGDERDPITYLRAFDEEDSDSELYEFARLDHFGIVVAISRPGRRVEQSAARRVDGGADWQALVVELVRRSRAVVFQCTGPHESSGYMWELGQLIPGIDASLSANAGPLVEPTKLIGVIAGGKKGRRRYADWAALVEPVLDDPLPPVDQLPGKGKGSDIRAWVTFTDDWKPCIVPTKRVGNWYHPSIAVVMHPAAREALDDLAQSQRTAFRRLADEAGGDAIVQLSEAYQLIASRLLETQISFALELSGSGEHDTAKLFARDSLHVVEHHLKRHRRKQVIKRAKEVRSAVEAAASEARAAERDTEAGNS